MTMTISVPRRPLLQAGRLMLATISLCAATLAQAAYVIESIPGPTADGIQIFGINNRGQLSGGTPLPTGPVSSTYDLAKRSFEEVPSPAGQAMTVLGIAENGQLVGAMGPLADPDTFVAFVRNNGQFTTFAVPGYAQNSARALNNNGTVTGLSTDPSLPPMGWSYDQRTQTFTPITFAGAALVIPQGVNNRGDIVGSASFPANVLYAGSPAGNWGFLMRKDGPTTLFRVNNQPTRARGISDSGQIAGFIGGAAVGFVVQLTSDAPFQAITATADQLIAVPGAAATFVQAIDNQGRVAGWSVDAATFAETAFVARPGR
jgi:uncharacterized membrane protein